MLIEFIGGKMDGMEMDVDSLPPWIVVPHKIPGQLCVFSISKTTPPPKFEYLIYLRKFPVAKPDKFYFDKIEEV